MFSENLSLVLLRYCEEKGISQERLAERCGLSSRFVGRIICRHSNPTLATLEKICDSLHMTPNQLLLAMSMENPRHDQAMEVNSLYVLTAGDGEDVYPLCPRCRCVVEREYQNYCENCGQRLSWKRLKQAERIHVGAMHTPSPQDEPRAPEMTTD